MRSIALGLVLLCAGCPAADLTYAPSPVDNPLKGLVPYAGQAAEFPHSLEFAYLPLADLLPEEGRCDWTALERLLTGVAGRHCQTIFRVWLDFPGRPPGMPGWLRTAGVAQRPLPAGTVGEGRVSLADYEDPRLRAALHYFIAALGARYDGDPRVGGITAGLLGWWGEWHTSPADALMASPAVQAEIMAAYAAAFPRTPVLLRYPRPDRAQQVFGYHDDSFAWATLPTGKPGDSWFFLSLLAKAGPEAQDRWRTRPIGGETRPEAWPTLWNQDGHPAAYQDYPTCVRATHASWLMDSSIAKPLTPAQRLRALEGARILGYEYQVVHSVLSSTATGWTVTAAVRNTGVAPFYADWPVELTLEDATGGSVVVRRTTGLLPGIPPEADAVIWRWDLTTTEVPPGTRRVLLRVPNPMPGGRPLRFANATADQTTDGALVLGSW